MVASTRRAGIAVTNLNGSVAAVALQTSGKILFLVDGSPVGAPSGVVRFNSNGTLDRTFGQGGLAAIPLPQAAARELLVQPDNRIVLGADLNFATPANKVGLARFLPNGTLDSTFGKNGLAFINEPGFVTALALARDGTIDALITFGILSPVYGVHFSANGVFIEAPPSTDLVAIESNSDMTFQPDAKIIFSPPVNRDSRGVQNFRFTKFNAPEPTFQRPLYSFGFASFFNVEPITVEPSGGILTAAGNSNVSNVQFGLARFNPNGSIDTGFGSGGVVQTSFRSPRAPS